MIGPLLGDGVPAVDLGHRYLARGEQRPEQYGGRFRRRPAWSGLDPALELFMQCSIALDVRSISIGSAESA
jgi:hypothetical protein